MNIIIGFTEFRLTLYSVFRFQSTVFVMADQNLLHAINVGQKNYYTQLVLTSIVIAGPATEIFDFVASRVC